MPTATVETTRDLDADLAICVSSSRKWPMSRVQFANVARQGWPYAIRRAIEAERENDRLQNELNILQEQLRRQSPCWD